MPIDASIPLQSRNSFDPLESYGKVLSLKSLLGQQQMQEMQMQRAQQQQQEEQALNDAYRTSFKDGQLDRSGLLSSLAGQGLGARIPSLQKQFADSDKAVTDAQKSRGEVDKQQFELAKARNQWLGGQVSALLSDPNLTHERVIQTIVQGTQQGVIPSDVGFTMARNLPADPARLRQALVTYGLQVADDNKRLEMLTPTVENVDLGNRSERRLVDRMTGAVKSSTSTVKAPEGFIVGPDGGLSVDPGFLGAKTQIANAGKTEVNVNTGQKGFDNTLKLRGDFRSEPVYKAHQEMQSAYSQIQQALQQKSPAGDLAGATKIMKLLDPGSVVRESELGMAMAATGLLDRVQSYATNVINGTKLTPKQRQDFQNLANALYMESVNQYNAKRSEYQGIAERNGLNVPDVLGGQAGKATDFVGRDIPTNAADPLGLRK